MALSLIFAWYVGIGLLCTAGVIALAGKHLSPKAQQVFFGLVLVPVAAMYLVFTAFFHAEDAWRLESLAVIAFVILGAVGTRVTAALVVGYAVHGAWDLVHELQAHAGLDAGMGRGTDIPLAYGAFCATFDWAVAAYFYTRRHAWSAAWNRREVAP